MTIDLAALQDAAEALAATARAVDEGRAEDAREFASYAGMHIREAFGIGAEHPEVGAFETVLAAATAELTIAGVAL